ncbi:uncharacterized protein LOC131158473 isoform X2 [Malania oleifera]|uniref:uncharacterized protein LOC131158473 isoform X2 n=1 Tax=Malania oleifera TaxID=397392 RepID=UPI0025AE5D82|nr:uncharacterized protein LOC131158473 isoform X2 [Malania oleifera]
MASTFVDGYDNMYDPRLKPRVLRGLVSDHLPYEDGPVPSRPEISNLAFTVRTFSLLSESLPRTPTTVDASLVQDWKSSVDAWVDRVVQLVSCDLPDKNWVGICMLGLTCTECSTARFLSSYPAWLDKLLSHIEPPSDFQSVKVASCNSMSDLFTRTYHQGRQLAVLRCVRDSTTLWRLGGCTNVKKDGTSYAGKLIQPILKLLDEDSSEAVLEGALCLLCTIITFFPSSLLRQYANAEATIVSKILSGRSSIDLLKKYAQCLALLPRSRGDEESWALMMEKILISINVYLSDAFLGLEEENKVNEPMELVVPPEEQHQVPIGSQTITGGTFEHTTGRSKLFLISTVPALLSCCSTMLTNSYPVQVTIPVRSLLTLVERVLMVDGSCAQASFPFMNVMQQEFISPELPVLHSYSLDLLTALIKGVRSQLLPHAAEIIRLLIWYFRRCALPTLRIKVYSIIRILLTSMGVGVALHLAEEVISNACIDLGVIGYGSAEELFSSLSKTTNEALLQPTHKKRNQASITNSFLQHQNGIQLDIFEVEVQKNCSNFPISLKIAALEALEALLTVGGSLGSDSLRSTADLLLITVATNACNEEWDSEEMNVFVPPNEPTSSWADFQLAALQALLASLLSPARVRPRFLSQGLELFQKGKLEIGTKLARFCSHALLALEVLMHPRFVPTVDFPSVNVSPSSEQFCQSDTDSMRPADHKNSAPFSTADSINDQAPYVYLHENWLKNGNETEALYSPSKDMRNTKELAETDVEHAIEVLRSENLRENGSLDVDVGRDGDEMMLELEQFSDIIAIEGVGSPAVTFADSEAELREFVSSNGAFSPANNGTVASKECSADVAAVSKTGEESLSTTLAAREK